MEIPALVTIAWKVLYPIFSNKKIQNEEEWEGIPSPIVETWRCVKKKFENRISAEETLNDLIKMPEDPDLQGAFRTQLRKLLEEDNSFASDLKQCLNSTEPAYISSLFGDGAIAQGLNARAVGSQGVLIEGNFQGNLYIGDKPDNDEQALNIFRRTVFQSMQNLPLRGIDIGASDPLHVQKPMGLANVYIDLDTEQENLKNSSISKDVSQESSISVLQAVISNRYVVLLGDPGSGKSTFINYITQILAVNVLEPNSGWHNHLKGWPTSEFSIIPLPVILRDFARTIDESSSSFITPKLLWDFIQKRLEAQNLSFVLEPLQRELEAGRVIILLDGLDEISTQTQRILVRDTIRAFIERYPKNRFLISCRILSYQKPEKGKPDLRINELPNIKIAQFDKTKIENFVISWYTELSRIGAIPLTETAANIASLRSAIQRPDLQRLAPNPLLLTVMALVHTHKGRLPDARPMLYEETIDILLWRWEQVKLSGKENLPRLRQALLDAGRTDVDIKRKLWELAYLAHTTTSNNMGVDTLADISEYELEKALAMLKPLEEGEGYDYNWARKIIDIMKTRSGLLLERLPGIFTFPHRTFQEYLAGAHLATQANFSKQSAILGTKSQIWREVILYAVGKLVYINGDIDKPLALVSELCPVKVLNTLTGWKQAWLAGDVLVEIGKSRLQDTVMGRDLSERINDRLEQLIERGLLTAVERSRVGITFSKLVGTSSKKNVLESINYCHVPSGKFLMGDEKNYRELDLPKFWMSKYPITNEQFQEFVHAGGYQQSQYWKEAILENFWVDGKFKGSYDNEFRTEPVGYGEPFVLSNHPVVGVTWYEALAFTRWLSDLYAKMGLQQLRKHNLSKLEKDFWSGLAENRYKISLPSEPEWEKAARGTNGNKFPWGKKPDPERANYDVTGIGDTSFVGCFPLGASPYGLQDMSGNVWEWTRSLYSEAPYPDNAEERESRENLMEPPSESRSIRGGSFSNDVRFIECVSRLASNPCFRLRNRGFRVSIST